MSLMQKLRGSYKKEFESKKYMAQFYSDINDWEVFLVGGLDKVEKAGKLRGPRGIEIGCGPTVHRQAVLARVCDVVVASDYSDSNCMYVKQWLETHDLDKVHLNHFKLVAKLEGHKDEVAGAKLVESRLRSKLKKIIHCDVTMPQPIGDVSEHGGLFDIAVSNGCLESACLTYPDYVKALRNISTILKPGAALVLSGYITGDFYVVGEVKYDTLPWDRQVVRKGLEEAGFKVDVLEVSDPHNPFAVSDTCNYKETFFSLSYKI